MRRIVHVLVAVTSVLTASLAAQTAHVAPATAPSTGRLTPAGEPGPALSVSGVVVDPDGKPVANASLYAFQTDAEGYYGVKPVSDNQHPRLKVLLRTDA